MQVERERVAISEYSGARVSNTWITCLKVGDNIGKPMLIPHILMKSADFVRKGAIRYERGPRLIS
jgi:hypothetical protein